MVDGRTSSRHLADIYRPTGKISVIKNVAITRKIPPDCAVSRMGFLGSWHW